MERWPAFLALGANLGDPVTQLTEAVARLERAEVAVVARSRLYRSAPLGPPGQPDYVNGAVEIATALEPEDLLAHTQSVEQAMGRVKTVRWGPRLVDIDIALFADRRHDTPDLTIPHRELTRRRFVLAPLADLAPEVIVPGTNRTITELLAALDDDPSTLSVLIERWG